MNRVIVQVREATEAGGIKSLESIPGLRKSLKIRVHLLCKTRLLMSSAAAMPVRCQYT
jgi:hypothetical protein